MTAAAALRWGAARLGSAHVPEPRREARLLLRATADVDAILHPDQGIEGPRAATYVAAISRRCSREPFAYIVAHRFFRDLVLDVDHRVLVPRPETELVVERAVLLAPSEARVVDLCTGSGAIALAVTHERRDLLVDATDVCPAALEVANRNVARYGDGRVALYRGDLWEALPAGNEGLYALCTCNPPYVEAADLPELDPEVRDWEPHHALVADEGWRSLYVRLASGAPRWLCPGGWLIAEVGMGQAETVSAVFAAQGLRDVVVHPDLAGIPRVVEGRRPA